MERVNRAAPSRNPILLPASALFGLALIVFGFCQADRKSTRLNSSHM